MFKFSRLALLALPLFMVEGKLFAKDVAIGTTIGDFADMVQESVKPQLEKKGYKVKLVQFTDYVQPNIALAERKLDANIFQHKPYLEEFAKEKGLKLSPLVQIPTAPLGVYPGKLKALSEAKDGVKVAIPNDATNLARALRIFADLGWIELKASSSTIQLGLHDIAKNSKGVKFIPLEAAQLPRAKEDVDFAVINGNYAVSSGVGLKAALAFEKSDAYLNWAAVRTDELGSEFAKDLKAALSSKEFRAYAEKKFVGYRFPSDWK